jgi:hypothetical protein
VVHPKLRQKTMTRNRRLILPTLWKYQLNGKVSIYNQVALLKSLVDVSYICWSFRVNCVLRDGGRAKWNCMKDIRSTKRQLRNNDIK